MKINLGGSGRPGYGSLLHFAVPNAGGTDAQTLTGALYQGMHGLQIQIPATLGHIMGMADTMPELRPAAADFTNF